MSQPGSERHMIKASFSVPDAKLIERCKVLSQLTELPTDPAIIADDVQTVAGLVVTLNENVDMLIQLFEQIAKAGIVQMQPIKPLGDSRPGRF